MEKNEEKKVEKIILETLLRGKNPIHTNPKLFQAATKEQEGVEIVGMKFCEGEFKPKEG